MGLVALWHVGSSRTRARTRVPCTGRRILNHCATREVPIFSFPNLYAHGHSSSWCVGLSLSRPLIVEHRLRTRRLSSCGSQAQLLRGMWDLPRPGLEPMSPALAGGFSTTAPPGKPYSLWGRLGVSVLQTHTHTQSHTRTRVCTADVA